MKALKFSLANPLVKLPIGVNEIYKGIDIVVVTHAHLDHWDDEAVRVLPKDIKILTQNESDKSRCLKTLKQCQKLRQ
ncbi:MBL fold metallo-hydrolase [Campylobacter gastrosuis]|uniref:MBL fold metallo-hydrolase n=1 Tax=Campylobacter gastrosuis TaxID=2974576 RepID=A0ABT7HS21_9BACT|nr:MBL fold metallo-hydrolase [Campylobacter gastrosuis]MDL0089707.1 MBL fold metallo-hydrolase [Campylobacter gastrosuis]